MKSRLWKFHSRCQEFEHICPRIRPPIFVFPRIPNGVPVENWKLPLQNFHAYGIEILFIQVWSGAISYVLLLPSLKILKILIFFRLHAIVLHTIEKSILEVIENFKITLNSQNTLPLGTSSLGFGNTYVCLDIREFLVDTRIPS